MSEAFDLIEMEKELCRRSLREFVPLAWDEVEPSRPYISSWHIDAILDHLQAVYNKDITRLVINVPPGSMKSLSCCVFFPTWVWTLQPGHKFIFSSYGDAVSLRDARRARRLIKSDWYQARWGDMFEIPPGEDTASRYANNRGGFRQSTTVRGGVTGEHADTQVVDDPVKPLEVTKSMRVAKTVLDECDVWWNETMSSRLVDFLNSARVIIMQRLHQRDLAGIAIEQGYELLRLPMEYVPSKQCFTSIDFHDPRKEEGELLCPPRFPAAAVAQLKEELGPRGAEAQLQQNPTPLEGTIIKREYIRYWETVPKNARLIQSWDCAFKDRDDSDYVVGQVWAVAGAEYYLLDQFRAKASFTDTCHAIKMMTSKWPRSRAKLVEDKANGTAVIDALKKVVPGLKPVNPEGGKESRLSAVEHLYAAGNVYFPPPDRYKWVDELVEEVVGFGSLEHDDQVDSMTQALVYMERGGYQRLKSAMEGMR